MRTGAPSGYVGNFHEAGFYRSDAEFLALIVPFVVDGLAAGEPVVIGYDARKCNLLRASLPAPEDVSFIADKSLYASPARAIEAYRRQFDRLLAGGAGQVRIAGDVPHEGNGGRFDGWDRYECAVNTVWQDYPVWSRCLYDAATVPDDVRDVVERTHPRLVTADGRASVSARYQDAENFEALAVPVDPLEASTPSLDLIHPTPEHARNEVARVAYGRIGTTELEELLFAVSEAVMNAHLHGRPPVTVRAWTAVDRAVVHVRDAGGGPADPLIGLAPSAGDGPGLGLWLSHQLGCLDIALLHATDGFTVRLRAGGLPKAKDIGRPANPLDLPLQAGTDDGALPGPGSVHAIDGDGASFCEQVSPARLVQLDALNWSEVSPDQRCQSCQAALAWFGFGPPDA